MSVTYYFETAGGLTGSTTTTTSGMTMNTDELLAVTSGSTVSSPILLISAVDLTGSGTAVSNPGGGQWVYDGGSITVSGISEALQGGGAIVESGGIIVSATVDPGAGLVVVDGGITSATFVSGGYESVFSGGLASGSVVSGGSQSVFAGGTATSGTISDGGFQEIYSGGTAISATISGYGTQDVWSGGTASGSILGGSGAQIVHAGGVAINSDITAGTAAIYGVDRASEVSSGGIESVMSGGDAISTVLVSGGQQIVSAGGVADGATIEVQGLQTIQAGGKATGTGLIGGEMVVLSGGLATDAVLSTGEIIVSAGGMLTNAIANGGLIEVVAGGTASGTTINGGQELLLGGTASGTVVQNGGSEVVMSGGSAVGSVIQPGSSETVYSGGSVTNLHLAGSAIATFEAGAVIVGDIVMSGLGGEIQFIGAVPSGVKIDGMSAGDSIDLAGVSYVAGAISASYADGELTIASGTAGSVKLGVASFALGTVPDGNIVVSADAHGGTLVSIVGETVSQATAAFHAGTLPSGVGIADTAADISANFAALESILAAGKLNSLQLTDGGIPTLSVTPSDLASYANVISTISGNFILGIDASAANVTITGLAGHGSVVEFSGASTQYTITPSGDGVSFTISGGGSVDHVSDVTTLQFSDVTEVVASTSLAPGATLGTAGIAELYAAVLGRAPDPAGLAYYEAQLKAAPGLSAVTVAQQLLSSTEYSSAHAYAANSAGDAQFVTDLYANLLHRTASTSELNFYENLIAQFTNGQVPQTSGYVNTDLQGHAAVVADIAASAEFQADIQITAAHPASASHWLLLI